MEPQSQPLVCPSHVTHYVAMVILGILIGAGVTFLLIAPSSSNTYQAGFDAAKKLVEESSVGTIIQTPADIRMLSGSVTKVEGNAITFRTYSSNPFEDQALADRIVTVSSDTTITKLIEKDPMAFQSEMTAFSKGAQGTKAALVPLDPPTPFSQQSATIADITVGSRITVNATDNIKAMKEFTASSIQVQQSAPVPANITN